MKKFVYPAVVFYDEDAQIYVMTIDELALVVEGSSVEEVHQAMNEALESYVTTAISFGLEIPTPENFNLVMARNPKNLCILVDTTIEEKKIKKFAE